MGSNDVYYRLYLDKDDLMTVITMQDFDELDYDQHRFYTNKEGEPLRFEDEDEAIKELNRLFKPEFIDPEYLRGDNLFGRMLKRRP